MFSVRWKAFKAFALVGVLSGLVVGCESGGVTPDGSVRLNEQNDVAKKFDVERTNALNKLTAQQRAEIVQANQYLEALARSAAKVLANRAERRWLHEECLRKFDGVTNALLNTLAKDRSHSWSKMMQNSSQETNAAFKVETAMQYLEGKAKANLHLFWYDAEKWDGRTAPIVVYKRVDKIKGETFLTGFDAQGKLYEVDEEFAQRQPVVVLTFNERTTQDGILAQTYLNLKDKNLGSTQAADNITINTIQFTGTLEDWEDGWPEVRAITRESGGGINLALETFYPQPANIPGTIYPSRSMKAATVSTTTEVNWWELDISVFEFWLGGDDYITTHQVATGTNTYSNGGNIIVGYTW